MSASVDLCMIDNTAHCHRNMSMIVPYRPYGKSLDNLEESVRGGKPVGGRENIIKLVMKQKEDEYTYARQFK